MGEMIISAADSRLPTYGLSDSEDVKRKYAKKTALLFSCKKAYFHV